VGSRKFDPEGVLAVFLDGIFQICLGFSWEFLLFGPSGTSWRKGSTAEMPYFPHFRTFEISA
jgi:hypothetical protein